MDKVVCLICSKEMSIINNRHLFSHGITTNEYKTLYPDANTMSDSARKKWSERASQANDNRRGVKRTDEVKAKISDKLKNRTPVNKGKEMSQSQKDLLSELAKKRHEQNNYTRTPLSNETKNKISTSLIGRELSYETKEKLSDSLKNNKRREGFRSSNETKTAISESLKRYYSNKPSIKDVYEDRINDTGLLLISHDDKHVCLKCIYCDHIFDRHIQMFYDSKWKKEICPVCYKSKSSAEEELSVLFREWGLAFVRNDRNIISPKELDFYFPDLNIAIEYCGLHWHSEILGKDRNYHRNKMIECYGKGIKLITIFEDEYIFKKELVISYLRNIMGIFNGERIFARNCVVKDITPKESNIFIKQHHLMGAGRANIHLGLFHEDELVSVMTFSNNDISRKSRTWDINRFVNKRDTKVIGSASKLFRHFITLMNPSEVISYADLRWGDGETYKHLGMTREKDSVSNYWYFNYGRLNRIHRYGLRKKKDEPKDITEWELRKSQKWNRIWDCGNAKWVYRL